MRLDGRLSSMTLAILTMNTRCLVSKARHLELMHIIVHVAM